MKFNNKISLLFAVMCCCTLIFTGCIKETIDVNEDVQIENNDPIKVINYGRSTNSKNASKGKGFTGTTLAVFSSEVSYKNYIEDLDVQVENWDDAFLAEWGHLNDDDLNAKEDELNFDSEKPLTDFENAIGLQSLRKQYLIAEEAWLNNEVLNEVTDPDSNPIYDFDENELAVMNTLAEIQIGTTIVKKLTLEEFNLVNQEFGKSNGGTYLVIEDSDYDALVDFNNGDVSVIGNDNVSTTNNPPATSCKYGKSKRKYIDTAPGKKIMALIKVPQPRWGANGKVKSKIKSYKKKRRRWKKWRTNIAAGASGRVYDTNCGGGVSYLINNDYTSTKRRKKRVYKWDNPYYGSHIVKNGEMKGLYKQNGVTKELLLTW
tara:strand:- start:909 stop:2030 length:1122 start_codon:yes stop_codon:yes gene_type:complete